MKNDLHRGWGQSRFTVVSMQYTGFILVLLFIIVLFSMQTTVKLLLLHPVFVML